MKYLFVVCALWVSISARADAVFATGHTVEAGPVTLTLSGVPANIQQQHPECRGALIAKGGDAIHTQRFGCWSATKEAIIIQWANSDNTFTAARYSIKTFSPHYPAI